MKTRRLGTSPIVVSDICMGTMTFGAQADEATAFRVLDQCFEAGINFYDTAENYPVPPDPKWAGRTEEILGRWMKTKNRDALIIATKVSGPSHGWIASAQRAGMTALDRHNITARARREPPAPADRLRRPLPDPLARPRHAVRGDDGGARRARPRRQGAHRRLLQRDELGPDEEPAGLGTPRGRALPDDPEQLQHEQPPLRGRARAGLPSGRREPDPLLAARRAAC